MQTFNTYNSSWDNRYLINNTWNESYARGLLFSTNSTYNASYASFNNTLNIQNLYNSTLTNYVGTVNNTLNIQNLYNSTASMIANLSISQAGISGMVYTNLALTNTSNTFVGWQNFTGTLNATSILMGGYNVTNWATNVSTNWTNLAVNELSSNFTLINSSVTQLYTFNNTLNIQNLYNATASMIANLSISQATFSGYAKNTTAEIQQLLAGTNISQYSFNQTLQTFNTYNSSWDNRYLINNTWNESYARGLLFSTNSTYNASYASFNNTLNIQNLYNSTLTNYVGTVNNTLNIQNLYNSTASMIANLSISQAGISGMVYTNLALTNTSNTFVGWQNFTGTLNATSILMGGYNVTNWATNVSTNWTNLAVTNYLQTLL